MTTQPIPNTYLPKATQQSICRLEQNGFTARRILPFQAAAGTHASAFRADFAKHTSIGLLVFSVRIDTDGNVTNPKP